MVVRLCGEVVCLALWTRDMQLTCATVCASIYINTIISTTYLITRDRNFGQATCIDAILSVFNATNPFSRWITMNPYYAGVLCRCTIWLGTDVELCHSPLLGGGGLSWPQFRRLLLCKSKIPKLRRRLSTRPVELRRSVYTHKFELCATTCMFGLV